MDASYAYLLGAYLGDGHITTAQRTSCLWVYCADDWPGIQREVRHAMREVLPSAAVSVVQRTGCTAVKSFTKHWICLFPQHGPGKKHTRPIVLEPWQQELVERHTAAFLCGLFHSDGCRITNWATRTVGGRTTRHEYPRWFFSNESADILGLCSAGLERLGIAHRFPATTRSRWRGRTRWPHSTRPSGRRRDANRPAQPRLSRPTPLWVRCAPPSRRTTAAVGRGPVRHRAPGRR
ncbi:hypothetical protein ACU61A_23630 [Pseudonocardia sichuanensis]